MLRETTVENGKVRGVACGWPSITAYYGIPYAAPPVGERRWREPAPAEDWEGVRDCARPSARCPQLGVEKGGFFEKEFYPVEEEMSEDCLYLNIWTPAQSTQERCPVIFWIHGGAFMTGYGHSAHFDGEPFARQGVILVTINYRINVFGWMVDPELSAESEHGVSGNYGLLDQIAALKWVRRNITNFGGDPDNITVAGQSAGAASVQALISSPLTKGDIAKAVFESGGGVDALPDMNYPKLADVEARMNLRESLGVENIAEARALSAQELLRRWTSTIGSQSVQQFPVVDGYVLPESTTDLVYEGKVADIPYLIGYTAKEGIVVTPTRESLEELAQFMYGEEKAQEYLALCPEGEEEFEKIRDGFFTESLHAGCEAWAEVLEENGRGPVYVYQLSRNLPGDDMGAFHASDLWYVFKTLMRCWRPWELRDYEIAVQMNTYWANFAKTGNPNGERVPEWTPFTKENPQTLLIGDDETAMGQAKRTPRESFRLEYLLDGLEESKARK